MFSLIISLILVISLLLWNFITAKGQWFLKITIMLLISTVSILIHMSLRSYLGWPSDGFGFPEDFHLKAVHINEPMNGEEGGIYLWITKFSVEENTLTRALNISSGLPSISIESFKVVI